MKNKIFLKISVMVFLSLLSIYSLSENENLVIYYSFDKIEDNTIKDLSGNNNNIYLKGPCLLVEGKKGNAIVLDSKTSFEISHNSSLNFKNGLTISFWLKLNTEEVKWTSFVKKVKGAEETPSYFKNNPPAYVPFKGFNFGTSGSSQPIHLKEADFLFTVSDGKSRETVSLNIGKYLKPEEWKYLTVSYNPDPKDRGLRIYIDGKLVCDTIMIDMPEDINNDAPIIIGKDLTYLIGVIDEFRIYSRALSEKEIEELFKSF